MKNRLILFRKKIGVINKKEDNKDKAQKNNNNNWTYEKYRSKLENDLLYLSKKQVQKFAEINKKMKPEDLVYSKCNLTDMER